MALSHTPHSDPKQDWDYIAPLTEIMKYINHPEFFLEEAYPLSKNKYYSFHTDLGISEYEIAWPESTGEELLYLVKKHGLYIAKKVYYPMILPSAESQRNLSDKNKITYLVPNMDVLYTLKMSHRFLRNSPHFKKTIQNILYLRNQKAKIPKELTSWFKRRENETYNYSHPNLKQTKQEFFKNMGDLQYACDHDELHEIVKLHDKPAYKMFATDGEEILSSENKFMELPGKFKIASVLEECYVLALERSQIPFNFQVDPKVSFDIALEKVCTSISSGWWREYAWENYYTIQYFYSPSYVDKFKKSSLAKQLNLS